MSEGLFFGTDKGTDSDIEKAAKEWYKHYSVVVKQVSSGKEPDLDKVGEAQLKLIETIERNL